MLLMGGVVYAPSAPFATAMMIDGGTIAWIGEDTAAAVHREAADVVVDLRGAFVAPGFVDAHVHATSTGLLLTGVDLTHVLSRAEALTTLAAHVQRHPHDPVVGHGWDETRWADGGPLTRAEIDGIAGDEDLLHYLAAHEIEYVLDYSADPADIPLYTDPAFLAAYGELLYDGPRAQLYRIIIPEGD